MGWILPGPASRAVGLAPFAWLLALATGCTSSPSTPSTASPHRVRELFDQIAIGMPRAEVEALLGPPKEQWDRSPPPLRPQWKAWYLEPPALEPTDSPYANGSIGVSYAADGTVAAKQLNPHVREKGASR